MFRECLFFSVYYSKKMPESWGVMKKAIKWTLTGVDTLTGIDHRLGRKRQDGRRRPRNLQCRREKCSLVFKKVLFWKMNSHFDILKGICHDQLYWNFFYFSKLHFFCLVDVDRRRWPVEKCRLPFSTVDVDGRRQRLHFFRSTASSPFHHAQKLRRISPN